MRVRREGSGQRLNSLRPPAAESGLYKGCRPPSCGGAGGSQLRSCGWVSEACSGRGVGGRLQRGSQQLPLKVQLGGGLTRCTAAPAGSVAWHAGVPCGSEWQRNVSPGKRVSEPGLGSTDPALENSRWFLQLPAPAPLPERGRAAGCFK